MADITNGKAQQADLSIKNPMKGGKTDAASAAEDPKDVSESTSPTSGSAKPTGPPAPPPVGYTRLFRFATAGDLTLMGFACVCGAGVGIAMPLFSIFFGDLLNAINSPDRQAQVNEVCTRIGILAACMAGAAYLSVALSQLSATRQIARMREEYMRALLRQEPGWFDLNRGGEVATRMAADTVTVAGGIGERAVTAFTSVSTFVAGFVIGFVKGWKMALVILGFLPVIAIVGGILNKYMMGGARDNSESYAKAGAVASEVLGSVRTVAAFNGEEAEVRRYDKHLAAAEKAGISKGWLTGASIGVLLFSIFAVYGIGLYFGGRLVVWSREDHAECATLLAAQYDFCFTGGNVIQVIFGLLIGASSLSQAGPAISSMSQARGAAAQIFAVIDRKPLIDVTSEAGVKPAPGSLKGRIEFKNVTFAYPSRPDQPVLKDFSIVIEGGQTTALVGGSGSGKSTIIALVQRWYDPNQGQILLDGIDIKDYNVAWLRDQQALVNQEPQLFATSLRENIALGKPGLVAATDDEVESASRAANAHDFIVAQQDGYATNVTGAQLSGGQKQRVAIARAIIRRAPILLLDEATSALDSTAERQIQKDIDRLLAEPLHTGAVGGDSHSAPAMKKRTAIVIAHRLSTVTRADRIVVLEKGQVTESGSHAELMSQESSKYRKMREMQRVGSGEVEADDPKTEASSSPSAVPDVTALAVKHTGLAGSAAGKDGAEGKKEGKEEPEEDAKQFPAVPLARILAYNKPETGWIIIALISSCALGVQFPAFSLLLSRFLSVYYITDNDELLRNTLVYLGWMMLIGFGSFVCSMTSAYGWNVAGERLMRRVRRDAFRGILRAEVGWHDMPEHSVGRITSRLAGEAELLKSTVGMNLNMNIQNAAGLISGLAIAFSASWRMTLVVLATAPIMAIGGALQVKFFAGFEKQAQAAFAECGDIATEAMSAIRVITAFGLHDSVKARFSKALVKPTTAASKGALTQGIGLAIGHGTMIGVYGLAFYVGVIFIDNGWMSFQELMQAFFAVAFAAVGMGNASAMATDAAKADNAKRALFAMIDRKSPIDPLSDVGVKPGHGDVPAIKGKIELRDVQFTYPARPNQQILKGLSLVIKPGQTAAIVGPSGSGKSTVVQLLERFYDPASGSVLLDDKPLSAYNVHALRAQAGWVQQEAPLFGESLAYNIQYGCVDDDAKPIPDQGVAPDAGEGAKPAAGFSVTQAILSAAEAANARKFIESFAHGFATFAGERGSQLSGGQKQRVAIARAIIRNPQVLLLDEATSALDSESEAAVQASIDALLEQKSATSKSDDGSALGQRTTIIIAHRLSTIKKADVIFVVDKGIVVESGSHEELMAIEGGLFARMVRAQDAGLGAAMPAHAHAAA